MWSCLLGQRCDTGRQGALAFSSPSPQQAASTSVNPEMDS